MKRFVITIVSLKLVFLVACLTLFTMSQSGDSLPVQSAVTASPRPEGKDKIERQKSEPYKGDLSIFESPERDKNLQIDRVMDILKISDGKTVADIGAGSGWFTVRAAKKVGAAGHVFAVEINQEYIDYINDRARKSDLTNIETIFGSPNDPMLPPNSLDAVMILKTYHEIAEPVQLMKKVRTAIKNSGLVGIIDRNGNGADHGLDKEIVVKEAKLAGFSLSGQYDFVKTDGMDYFLVFEPKM